MFYSLLVLVLFTSFKDSFERKVQDPNRIKTLINLINNYTVDHGEALRVKSLNDLRRDKNLYVAYGFNKSVDYNVIPQMVSSLFDVNKFLTGVILGVNHNGTTKWTTTTENFKWRRKGHVTIPRVVHRESGSMSMSKSFEDSKSNERWIPNGRRYFDSEEFAPLKTTKDPFEDATPFKLNYEEVDSKNKNTKDGKGRGSTENIQQDKSDWNRPNRKEKDNWDKPVKSGNGWDEKQETTKKDRNKSNSNLDRQTKDSEAKEFADQFQSKKTKKNDYSDYGNEKKISEDTNSELKMKAKDDWDRPLNNDDFGKSKNDHSEPMKIIWNTKKNDNSNKKPKDDWDKLLKDSREKEDGNRNKKAKDDWDKPLKNSWETKKDGYQNKKSKDDWDKPLKDSWETKKDGNQNKKSKVDWDKPLKDSWETKKNENRNKKSKDDWDKPLKDSWESKKDDWDKPLKDSWDIKKEKKQSRDDWDKPKKIDWDTPKKVDWDTPKKVDWGAAKTTKEWKRPPKLKVAELINERHYPTYDERPRHDKRNRAVGGFGRTPIPFVGKRGIYEDK